MAARICPRCSTRVDERRAGQSPYCLSCGAALGTNPNGFAKPAARSSVLPWIIAGGAVFLLVVLGIVLVLVLVLADATPDRPVASVNGQPDSGPLLEVPTTTPPAASSSAPRTLSTVTARPIVTTTAPRPTAPQPTTPIPSVSPLVLGAFPRARATNELDRVTASLASCSRTGDPSGSGSIRVDFEPDGRVGTLLAKPFAGTPTGSCIASRFLAIRIGAFTGTTQPITRTFTIPSSTAF